jgi:hypothetical protein
MLFNKVQNAQVSQSGMKEDNTPASCKGLNARYKSSKQKKTKKQKRISKGCAVFKVLPLRRIWEGLFYVPQLL